MNDNSLLREYEEMLNHYKVENLRLEQEVLSLQQQLDNEMNMKSAWEQLAKTGLNTIIQKWLDEKLGAGKSVV